jgi:CRP/FNR family transcriptional regulator, cyclic AMP receptor protein
MDRETLLSNIPLFESLAPEDLTALAARLEERPFEPGAAIFNQGDEGATLFIINEGAVEISVGQGKAKVVLANLFQGHYFGELSLFDGAPRSATATASKPTELLALDRDDFAEFLKKKPEAAMRVLSEMAEKMRQTNELMSRQVSKNVVEEVESKLTMIERAADWIAAFSGSMPFLIMNTLWFGTWLFINVVPGLPKFDPFPFGLLTMIVSLEAIFLSLFLLLSQNRSAAKDKALAENDFQVNLKNEIGIDTLLKGQAELVARLAILERRLPAQTTNVKTTSSG